VSPRAGDVIEDPARALARAAVAATHISISLEMHTTARRLAELDDAGERFEWWCRVAVAMPALGPDDDTAGDLAGDAEDPAYELEWAS
jgi:hypothetical protein